MVDTILTNTIDPVEGLVNYTNFVKPYHSKILEILVTYIHADCIDVTFTEGWHLSLGMPAVELLPFWGWTVEEAERFFRGDYNKFQISKVHPGDGYIEVIGDASTMFVGSPAAMSEILVQVSDLQFQSYTVISTSTSLTACTVNDPYYGAKADSPLELAFVTGTKTRTRLYVAEVLPAIPVVPIVGLSVGSPLTTSYWEVSGQGGRIDAGDTFRVTGDTGIPDATYTVLRIKYDNLTTTTRIFIGDDITGANGDGSLQIDCVGSSGIVVPKESMAQTGDGATWQSLGGLVFPSNAHIEKNVNCGGYGSIFEQTGSPVPSLPNGLDNSNQILGVSTVPMYFEISNRDVGVAPISSWKQYFPYGAKFSVTGSSGNDNDGYTVFHATTVYGSPATTGSPEILRIYTLENIPSSISDGTLQLAPWGYDEPTVCVEQGQSLSANPYFAESMSMTINDNATNFVQGLDVDVYDMDGYDGGPFTFQVVFT